MKKLFIIINAIGIIFLFYQNLLAYDKENVHPRLNEFAIRQSVIDVVLKNNVGLKEGIEAKFVLGSDKKYIWDWFRKGGTDEDFFSRPIRHFHDPLRTWDQAGFKSTYESALLWGQRSDQAMFGTYSWRNARDKFYTALLTGNETTYAETFLMLGYVMHLVADMAVPEHVRNDMHPVVRPYEDWAGRDDIYKTLNYSGIPVDLSIFSRAIPSTDPDYSQAPIPISALWDQNKYNASNPDQSLTWSSQVGLAEFTNANFVSHDTQFTSDYPHPVFVDTDLYNLNWQSPELIDAEDGKIDNRLYLLPQNGPMINIRLAAVGYLDYHLLKIGATALATPVLDETVHNDYASVLIPKAVGYSTALLNYFFRGVIEITGAETVGGNPVLESVNVVRYQSAISEIRAELRNNSMLGKDGTGNPIVEPISGGTIRGVAQYKANGASTYSYKASPVQTIATLPDATPTPFTFDFSADQIPAGVTDLALLVVYKGTLGREESIGVAVGRKELVAALEITPPAQYVYSIIDGSTLAGNSDYLFTKIKAKVRNSSPNGEPLTGSLKAVAEYRRRTNYTPDLANDPPNMAEREAFTSFSESATLSGITIEAATAREFTFDFAANPIPAGIPDLYLNVVYEADGNQQAGEEISFALGRKDLNEPQQLTFWNDTDYFLLNGQPRLATDIQNDPNVSRYGYIWPFGFAETIGFSAVQPTTGVPLAATFELGAARHSRILVLTDNPTEYWVADNLRSTENPQMPPNGYTFVYSLPVTINQEDPQTHNWVSTIVPPVRGLSQHQSLYFMNAYPYFIYINTLPAPHLAPVPATINY